MTTSSSDDCTCSSSRARIRARTAPPGTPGARSLLARHEQFGDDPRRVGTSRWGQRVTARLHGSHCAQSTSTGRACNVESTARVDSAPWLRFTRRMQAVESSTGLGVHMTCCASLAPMNSWQRRGRHRADRSRVNGCGTRGTRRRGWIPRSAADRTPAVLVQSSARTGVGER